MTQPVQQPVLQVAPIVPPSTLPPSSLSTLPVSPPSSEGSSMKWWILAMVLFLIFVGIVVWYFSTRP